MVGTVVGEGETTGGMMVGTMVGTVVGEGETTGGTMVGTIVGEGTPNRDNWWYDGRNDSWRRGDNWWYDGRNDSWRRDSK